VVQHRQDAWHFFCFATVDARNPSRANSAADSNSPSHVFERVLDTVGRAASDLQNAVYTRNVFSDDRALFRHANSFKAL